MIIIYSYYFLFNDNIERTIFQIEIIFLEFYY